MKATFLSLAKKGIMAVLLSLSLLLLPSLAQETDSQRDLSFSDPFMAGLSILTLDDFRTREMFNVSLNVGDDWSKAMIGLSVHSVENHHRRELLEFDQSGLARVEINFDLDQARNMFVRPEEMSEPMSEEMLEPMEESVERDDLEVIEVMEEEMPVPMEELVIPEKSMSSLQMEDFINLHIQGDLQSVIKNERLYLRLNNITFNYQMAESDFMGEEDDLQKMKTLLESIEGQWYYLPASQMQNLIFSGFYGEFFGLEKESFDQEGLEELIKDHFNEVTHGNKNWKEAAIEIAEALFFQDGQTLFDSDIENDPRQGFYEEQRSMFLTAMKEVLASDIFSQRKGQDGEVFFSLDKMSVVGLFRNLGMIFEGEVNEEEALEFVNILENVSFNGRYKINEQAGILDHLMVQLDVQEMGELQHLEMMYGMMVENVGNENRIGPPADAESIEVLEDHLFESLGMGADGNCSIQETMEREKMYFGHCYGGNEDLLTATLQTYTENQSLSVNIPPLAQQPISEERPFMSPDFEYYTFECTPSSADLFECNYAHESIHAEIHKIEHTRAHIHCRERQDGSYQCRKNHIYSSSDFSRYEEDRCQINQSKDVYYVDCSQGDRSMLESSLRSHLQEADLSVQVNRDEKGFYFYICEDQGREMVCDEVRYSKYEALYQSKFIETIYQCSKIDESASDDEATFECEKDERFMPHEYCLIHDLGGQLYADCNRPDETLLQDSVNTFRGEQASLQVNHMEEGGEFYYVCSQSVCNEIERTDYEDKIHDLDHEEIVRVSDCYRQKDGFYCSEPVELFFDEQMIPVRE